MQIISECTGTRADQLAWHLTPGVPTGKAAQQRFAGPFQPSELRKAQLEVARQHRMEQWVWLALALIALEVLWVSFGV